MDEAKRKFFTVVFEGDLLKVPGNPLAVDTPFGRPVAISLGNVLEKIEDIHEIEDAARRLVAKIDVVDL